MKQAGKLLYENTKPLGEFLRDVMRNDMTNFRVFGPDETESNRLQAMYEVSKKVWMADLYPEDADGVEPTATEVQLDTLDPDHPAGVGILWSTTGRLLP